jgi:hypothetical protein
MLRKKERVSRHPSRAFVRFPSRPPHLFSVHDTRPPANDQRLNFSQNKTNRHRLNLTSLMRNGC